MQITHIDIFRFSIQMEPFAIATGVMRYAQNTLIRIHTDSGLTGLGECSAFPMIVGETQDTCLVLAKDFAKIWKGKNPLEIKNRLQELHQYIANNSTIKSAFDMALYDIASKASDLPLYRYLGGQLRDIVTDITIGLSAPAIMAQKALEFKKNGAEVLKVKLGKQPQHDIERIKAIREAIGFAIPIRIDANQGWTFEEARLALTGLAGDNIQFCEQPMRSYDDPMLPQLKKHSPIPIMADESCYNHHDAIRLIEADACDAINIKLAKSGGIFEALKIHEIASKKAIPCMIGGMLESRLALSAKVHFAYACPSVVYYDLDTCMIGHLEDPIIDGVQFDGYQINLPSLPGIGAQVDEAFLKGCDRWTV